MKNYFVYFDAFGKKLKVKVKAATPEDAAIYVRKSISIEKIEEDKEKNFPPKSSYDQFVDELSKTFGDDFTNILRGKGKR